MSTDAMLVVCAHPGDLVWRAAGAVALAVAEGRPVTIVCLSYGERGESASQWRAGKTLEEIKSVRHDEGRRAADVLGADIEFLDAGDYPLEERPGLLDRLIATYRRAAPAVVLTHTESDPYNTDHPVASALARKARILAQAPGVAPGTGEVLGAPPVFYFEPHQPEMCGFRPDVLLDVTEVWPIKRKAMEQLAAQGHLLEYYSDLGRRRGVQARRNSGPNLGLSAGTYAEAFQRVFPQVTRTLS